MRYKLIWIVFLGILAGGTVSISRAEEPVILQSVERKQGLASTTVTFRFSELPEYEVQSGGQRVDITFLGKVIVGDIGSLPEDERIIKVLLAGHRKGLLTSLLFRSPPARVSLEKNVGKRELEIDCLWSEPHGARPGMAMYIKGMPVPQEGGTAVTAGVSSRFSKDWNSLYLYHTPLDLQIPVSIHVPQHMPLPEGPWYSGMRASLAAARAGRWEEAAVALETVRPAKEEGVGFLALSASVLLHAGEYAQAEREAARLVVSGQAEVPVAYGTYVRALALARSGKYLEAQMALRSRLEIARRGGDLAPYLRLLLAELALQQGRPEQAGAHLAGEIEHWPQSLRRAVRIRRGDLLAESGKTDEALQAYAVAENLSDFPSSLWRKAELLFKQGEFDRSASLYALLKELMQDWEPLGLVQWRESLALVHAGRVDDAVFLLKMVVQDYYETEAFDRARLTLLDLGHRGLLEAGENLAGVSYARVAMHSRVRALRQEAMLKQALALHQEGSDRESVAVLERFLHEFINGSLRQDGQALLAFILPGVVESLIDAGESLQALVLVERNRDLLINSRMRVGFLKKLADGFAGLTLFTRASRVLQYLIDAGEPSSRKDVYVPLAQVLVRLGQPGRLERLVREYESGSPQGKDRAVLHGLWAEALMDAGDVDGAVRALPVETALGIPKLEQQLARIHWRVGNMDVVASCLENVDLAKNMHVYSAELFLRGEALLALGRYREALPLLKALSEEPDVSAGARYRLAGALVKLGQVERARALLDALQQDSGAGQWAVLAGESIADLDLGEAAIR